MNRTFLKSVIASTLLAVSAFGQYDRPGLFDKARMDLDRAGAYPYASQADPKRFDEARGKLFDFESRFDRGRCEKHQLDGAIDHIRHVVNSNSLSDDLRRMRDYREFRNHHGE